MTMTKEKHIKSVVGQHCIVGDDRQNGCFLRVVRIGARCRRHAVLHLMFYFKHTKLR